MSSSPRDWFPANQAPTKSEGRELTFTTTMSTIEDLSYTPSELQKSRDLAQIKATGRRSWKTLKGKAEAVWGPELEAVLIEALEQYQYTDEHKPQTSKHGVRFPYRNRFISQYIYEKTGKNRTHKQVGSRLQQLRDTCEDSRILALISRGSCDDPEDECKVEPDVTPPPSKRARASDSPFRHETEAQGRQQVVVYTQVVAQLSTPSYSVPRLQFVENELSNPVNLPLPPIQYPHSVSGSHQSTLSMFSNTIQLYSNWSMNQETKFTIYEGEQVVRQEKVNLRLVARPSEACASWIYECDIAGQAWKAICAARDPNRITILQSLTPTILRMSTATSNPLATASPLAHAVGRKVSIVYHFDIEGQLASTPPPAESSIATGYGTGYPSRTPDYGGQPRSSSYSGGSQLPSSMHWPSDSSSGYQGRSDTSYHYDPIGVSQPQAHHVAHGYSYQSQSYPPTTMGFQGPNYVLGPQALVRSSSAGSSGGSSDYDGMEPSESYLAEPRATQHWAAMSGSDPSLHSSFTGVHAPGYGVGYAAF